MKHILKCRQCNAYTLKVVCKCSGKTVMPKPAKFSPEDRYGQYRRIAKLHILTEKGLL